MSILSIRYSQIVFIKNILTEIETNQFHFLLSLL